MGETDRATFIEGIYSDPTDITARLVFADWLDERGDPDGELVRLLCEVQISGYERGPAAERLESLTGGLQAEIDRLCERDQRLLVADYAEWQLPLFERQYPNNNWPRRAIATARRYAVGRLHQLEVEFVGHALGASISIGRTPPADIDDVLGAAQAAYDAITWPQNKANQGSRSLRADDGTLLRPRVAALLKCPRQLCRAVEYRLGFVPLPTFEE